MAFKFENISAEVRECMLEELADDLAKNQVYLSSRLTESGKRRWPEIAKAAFESGTEVTLGAELQAPGLIATTEVRRKPSGGTTTVKVPINAAQVLAEGEFGRYYIRGLCKHLIKDGSATVEVYRAKEVVNPRPESEAAIGRLVQVDQLLADLRQHIGVDTVLGLPPGPNSGLSVRIRRAL